MNSIRGRRNEMRVRLKGLNSITKKLADGSRRTYYYAWKGGPRLEGKLGSPNSSPVSMQRLSPGA
jgi:hypothetical protein